jgi:hypothetical protein
VGAKSINVEVGINVEGGIFWKKLVHNCNKRRVEGGKKSNKSINAEGENVSGGWIFSKISKCDFPFIREMRVHAIWSYKERSFIVNSPYKTVLYRTKLRGDRGGRVSHHITSPIPPPPF